MLVLENVHVFDGERDALQEDQHILIEGDLIREVSDKPITSATANRLDLNGAHVMPGLIDAHVHVTDWVASPAELVDEPPSYTAIRSARNLKNMLYRGFTTVRDACGADFGLARAVNLSGTGG